jgi:hypothetical protein
MNDTLELLKHRFVLMLIGDVALLIVAACCAVAYFVGGVGWALWGFVGFLAAAFGLQLWFIRGLGRQNKGG